jgi:HSP20 family protein
MLVKLNFDEPINELMRDFLTEEYLAVSSLEPAIDIAENENESLIVVELPGVKKEDISISVENGWLTLKGERKAVELSDVKRVLHREIAYEPFKRSIKLPHPVNVNNISAELVNGILKISLPKAEEVRPRSIEIK